MEESKKSAVWKKILAPLGVMVVILAAILMAILKLVELRIISTVTGMVLICVIIVAVFGLIFVVLKAVVEPILAVVGKAGNGKEDKFSAKVDRVASRDDELGKLIRTIREETTSFANVLSGIRKASDELGAVSDDFQKIFGDMTSSLEDTGEAVEKIAGNTVSQADHTLDMKEKIDAISQSIDRISENIEHLTKSAATVRECNDSAEGIMKELITISRESGEAIDNVRKQTDLTNKSAQQIRTATEIIAGISSQTNLLALNASIEAARAGEHGKGFAVVAEEIRTLADQSRESTEQINQIVNDLIQNSNVSVEITEKVTEAFARQNEKIQDTEEIFKSLNTEIQQVSDSIGGIGMEVGELKDHKNVIENGITSLTEVAEQNADSAKVTTDNMEKFREIAGECDAVQERVVSVSDELLDYIKQVNTENIRSKREKLLG